MSRDQKRNTNADLEQWFTYHAPRPDQLPRYEVIRAKARHFAEVLRDLTPEGPDQTVALRKIREAVMTANQAIAMEEDPDG